jgi:hypothetical protein
MENMMSEKPAIRNTLIQQNDIASFINDVFKDDFHAKRILSIQNAVTGILHSASLSVSMIGKGLAFANGLMDKHAIKQVDRLFSNKKLDVDTCSSYWVPYLLTGLEEVFVNLDWTEFDKDKHSTLVLSIQTVHGRAIPLLWKTFSKPEMKGNRNKWEDDVLDSLHEIIHKENEIDPDIKVTIIADRGFCDTKLFSYLTDVLHFEYIIRIKSNIFVTDKKGVTKSAKSWVGNGGRMKTLKSPLLTKEKIEVPGFLVVQDKNMKDAWCLAFSENTSTGTQIKMRYGKRFSCEETFRDLKDLHFGMGMKWTRIRVPERRDRILLLASLAHTFLTLLGAAGERCGLDRMLKPNTSKKRVDSLFKQGLRWYTLMPRMPEERLQVLMKAYQEILNENQFSKWIWGIK